jgi:hypothetical protein
MMRTNLDIKDVKNVVVIDKLGNTVSLTGIKNIVVCETVRKEG